MPVPVALPAPEPAAKLSAAPATVVASPALLEPAAEPSPAAPAQVVAPPGSSTSGGANTGVAVDPGVGSSTGKANGMLALAAAVLLQLLGEVGLRLPRQIRCVGCRGQTHGAVADCAAGSLGLACGQIGGLLEFRDTVLTPAQAELGKLAVGLAETFNSTHRQGVDLYGQMGGDFFNIGTPRVTLRNFNSGEDGRVGTGLGPPRNRPGHGVKGDPRLRNLYRQRRKPALD